MYVYIFLTVQFLCKIIHRIFIYFGIEQNLLCELMWTQNLYQFNYFCKKLIIAVNK